MINVHESRRAGQASGPDGRGTEPSGRVSVIVPTYNRCTLLRGALESVCGQTHRNLEIIVIDDASDDDTEMVVRSVGDPRIRYLRHEANRGGQPPAIRGFGPRVANTLRFSTTTTSGRARKSRNSCAC